MRKMIITAAMSLLLTLSANAELKNANNEILGKVKTANEQVSTISCAFKQTKKMAFIEQPTQKEGNFNFAKPDKLSMIYSDGEAVVINGATVQMGRNGKVRNMKAKNKHVEALASTLLACMNGELTKLDGTLKSAEQKGNAITFKLDVSFSVGKGKISKLELVYDKKDMTIKSINMIEDDGSNTLYELQTKTLNKSINESVFTLKK